jgi:hypothetical protein
VSTFEGEGMKNLTTRSHQSHQINFNNLELNASGGSPKETLITKLKGPSPTNFSNAASTKNIFVPEPNNQDATKDFLEPPGQYGRKGNSPVKKGNRNKNSGSNTP